MPSADVAAMAVSSGLVNTAIKPVVGRRRPDLAAHPVHRLLHHPVTTHSFPSGHSSSAGAFVTGLALECPPAGAALAPLALAVGYSRVHVGVHYPGDVVAGLAVGAAVAAGGRYWWPARPAPPGTTALSQRSGGDLTTVRSRVSRRRPGH